MKFNLKLAIFIVFLIVPFAAFGQGSGSSGGSKPSGEKMEKMVKKSNFAINRSSSGTVSAVSGSAISIRTSAGKTHSFTLGRKTRFAGGRPRKGDKVKVTYLAQNRQAILVRRG
jgi:hypothetical protein